MEDYDQFIKNMLYRSENRFTIEELFPKMKVIPVNFAKHHKDLLKHTQVLLKKGYLAINPKFDKLNTGLRTAVTNEYIIPKVNVPRILPIVVKTLKDAIKSHTNNHDNDMVLQKT